MSDYKSVSGRLRDKNWSQNDAVNTKPGDLQEKGNTGHIDNNPVVEGGLLTHTLPT